MSPLLPTSQCNLLFFSFYLKVFFKCLIKRRKERTIIITKFYHQDLRNTLVSASPVLFHLSSASNLSWINPSLCQALRIFESLQMQSLKEKVDDVLHAKWIVPVVPDNLVLENHSLVIKDGKWPPPLLVPPPPNQSIIIGYIHLYLLFASRLQSQ